MESARTLWLAITLTSPSRRGAKQSLAATQTNSAELRFFIAFSCPRASPQSEINAGLEDQRVGIRLIRRILLGVGAVGIRAISVAIHEMTLQFHVPVAVDVDPSADHFVEVVGVGQAGVGKMKKCRSNRVMRVIGANRH